MVRSLLLATAVGSARQRRRWSRQAAVAMDIHFVELLEEVLAGLHAVVDAFHGGVVQRGEHADGSLDPVLVRGEMHKPVTALRA